MNDLTEFDKGWDAACEALETKSSIRRDGFANLKDKLASYAHREIEAAHMARLCRETMKDGAAEESPIGPGGPIYSLFHERTSRLSKLLSDLSQKRYEESNVEQDAEKKAKLMGARRAYDFACHEANRIMWGALYQLEKELSKG